MISLAFAPSKVGPIATHFTDMELEILKGHVKSELVSGAQQGTPS